MRAILILGFLASHLVLSSIGGAAGNDRGEPNVALSISGDSLGQVLNLLSREYGYNFIVHPGVQLQAPGPQLYFTDVPFSRAISIVAAAYGACAAPKREFTVIRPCS